MLPPGLCISATIVGLALIGFGLEERGQPSLRRHHLAHRPHTVAIGGPTGQAAATPAPVLEIEGLWVGYDGLDVLAVCNATLTVHRGEIVGVVGASGSGKSTLVAAMSNVVQPPAHLVGGAVRLYGREVAHIGDDELRKLRGERVALIPQNAMTSLNPVHRIGDQIAEAIEVHHQIRHDVALGRAAELLELVGIPAQRSRSYPHEFSGGMRQRVVLAMALSNGPDLLIADEPTTGLDVVVAQQILALLTSLQRSIGLAVVVVSHDLPAVTGLVSRLVIMQQGRIVEQGDTGAICAAPSHPYTRALLDSVPQLRFDRPRPVLEPAR